MSTQTATNVTTHTGTVHAGRTHADGRPVPVCMSNTQVAELHFSAPTTDAVTCRRCQAGTSSTAASPEQKKARAAERRAADRRRALETRAAAPARRSASYLDTVTFLSQVAADETRTAEDRAAAAATLVERAAQYAALTVDAAAALAELAAL